MQSHHKKNIITLSEHPAFEKRQLFMKKTADNCLPGKASDPAKKEMDFIETLFRFLGHKRHLVISFIKMKFDPRTRIFFDKEIKACMDQREEGRCVKRYFGRLKAKDARALIMGLFDMLPGKIEALIYHGETEPENRLKKFVKTFSLSEADVTCCMLFLLLTRESNEEKIDKDVAIN
ncbi:MAG: hypothetical protein ACKVE4_10605 [Dissulfuribacterales bacterium]